MSSESYTSTDDNNNSSPLGKLNESLDVRLRIRPADSFDQGDDSGVVQEPEDAADCSDSLTQVTLRSPLSSPPVSMKSEKFRKSSNSNTVKTVISSNGSVANRALKSLANKEEYSRLQSNDLDISSASSFHAAKSLIQSDDFMSESSQAKHMNNQTMRIGDQVKSSASVTKGIANSVTATDGSMSKEQVQFQSQNCEAIVSPNGSHFYQKNNAASRSHYVAKSGKGGITTTTTSSSSSSSSTSMIKTYNSGSCCNLLAESFDGTPLALSSSNSNMLGLSTFLSLAPSGRSSDSLFKLDEASDRKTLESEYPKAEKKVTSIIEKLKNSRNDPASMIKVLPDLKNVLKKAWVLLGNDYTYKLCDKIRASGALDIILENLKGDPEEGSAEPTELRDICATVLQYCFSIPNVQHVLASPDSDKIVKLATSVSNSSAVNSNKRAGVGILANLFLSSEETCKALIKLGALDTINSLSCFSIDEETWRNCAYAYANLALFGGPECHSLMIKENVLNWLFVLGYKADETVVFLASHAIAALAANKEKEGELHNNNNKLLAIIDKFLKGKTPQEFAVHNPYTRMYGQSKDWLKKFSCILECDCEEAKQLAAFHFAVTAYHKKRQGDMSVFKEIGAIDLLQKVASSPNALASKYAAQALKMFGVEVTHKLSQQVPLWSVEDVKEWVKQINFSAFAEKFSKSAVDGDLLLQMTEENLKSDIAMDNGILRKRFLRELAHLKQIADYSSIDSCKVTNFLEKIGPSYVQYAYNMLNSGVDEATLPNLTEEQLINECKISNSIHRLKILQSIKEKRDCECSEFTHNGQSGKSLDVFVSYRRSTGSQLASLLKVLLQMRGFSTFLDIERLEAGKFDYNLINSIHQAKNFILVLTPCALDRCIGDNECKDWVHREIVEALKNGCNIIPVISNYELPEPDLLPDDMRSVCTFNGIKWIHEYQDACIDKLDRFMKGVLTTGELEQHNRQQPPVAPSTSSSPLSPPITMSSP